VGDLEVNAFKTASDVDQEGMFLLFATYTYPGIVIGYLSMVNGK